MITRALALALLQLLVSAGITIAAVRLLLMNGLEQMAERQRWSAKSKGQVLGYVTSLPELVVVVATAFNGLESFAGGFWNIASSNVINLCLFLAAVAFYLRQKELLNPRFLEEIAFCGFSVSLPLLLAATGVSPSLLLGLGLFGGFCGYQLLDRSLADMQGKRQQGAIDNGTAAYADQQSAPRTSMSLTTALILVVSGTLVILLAGRFLGNSAEVLIEAIHVPAWMVGWCLGFITSIPELTAFFELYGRSKVRGELHKLDDTQAGLDALVSSNMANIGLIFPLGLLVFSLSEFLGLDSPLVL